MGWRNHYRLWKARFYSIIWVCTMGVYCGCVLSVTVGVTGLCYLWVCTVSDCSCHSRCDWLVTCECVLWVWLCIHTVGVYCDCYCRCDWVSVGVIGVCYETVIRGCNCGCVLGASWQQASVRWRQQDRINRLHIRTTTADNRFTTWSQQ